MELELSGHVAVITGGAQGIGLACARGLAKEGCHVAIWDVARDTKPAAAKIAEEFGRPSTGLVVDVADAAAVADAVTETEAALGPISHLVHAAAAGSGKFGFPFTNLEPGDWPRVLQVNVMGMVHVAHAMAPGMISRRSGTMVFLASVAGQIGSQTDPPYSASKAANINFAQCLAKDLAPHNIRVNTVSPGMVQTKLNRQVWQAWRDLQPPDKRRSYEDWAADKIRAVAPLGRWQRPEDIADMVVFLSSARAAQVTGQTINVDGGQVMHA
ncbi:MAG TPA: SDR family oxidoreductase [Bryobacteraceae bacterium]|nr:SDR family oxidoreductase [Bryobacteraceae bacterium]